MKSKPRQLSLALDDVILERVTPALGDQLRVLCIPDVHAPVHDAQAWAIVIAVARMWRPDVIIQLGDFLDVAACSTYAKDPRRTATLREEADAGNVLLDELDAAAPLSTRVMLGSNHAERVRLYLQRQAPELLDVAPSYEALLRLEQRGWLSTPYRQALRIGDCYFAHDVGYAGSGGTLQSLNAVGKSIVMGHQHRLNQVFQGTALGVPHVAASLGWLGDVKHVDYQHRLKATRDWQIGFGTMLFRLDGKFSLRLHAIVAGRAEVDGVLYGTAPAKKRA